MDAILLFFQLGAANFALWSAVFWTRSARVHINWDAVGDWDGPGPEFMRQLKEQARFNKLAAVWASVSGFFASVSVVLQANPF